MRTARNVYIDFAFSLAQSRMISVHWARHMQASMNLHVSCMYLQLQLPAEA